MKKNENGFSAVEILLVILIMTLVIGIGWYFFQRRDAVNDPKQFKDNSQIQHSELTSDNDVGYVNIEDWGVMFPAGKIGKFTYHLPTEGQGATPQRPEMGGSDDMQYVYINVSGFTKDENNCVEKDGAVLGLASIYRHKEQNPIMNSATNRRLNPIDQVKIGEWYYSTSGLSAAGNCFEDTGELPSDYISLTKQFLENFKKLEKL